MNETSRSGTAHIDATATVTAAGSNLRQENESLRAACRRLWLLYHEEHCHEAWPHPLPCWYLPDDLAVLLSHGLSPGDREKPVDLGHDRHEFVAVSPEDERAGVVLVPPEDVSVTDP